MPANRTNYIIVYKDHSQIYAAGSKAIALSTEPPEGVPIEDKRVFFITYRPDDQVLSVHQIPQDEVRSAEIIKRKKKSQDND